MPVHLRFFLTSLDLKVRHLNSFGASLGVTIEKDTKKSNKDENPSDIVCISDFIQGPGHQGLLIQPGGATLPNFEDLSPWKNFFFMDFQENSGLSMVMKNVIKSFVYSDWSWKDIFSPGFRSFDPHESSCPQIWQDLNRRVFGSVVIPSHICSDGQTLGIIGQSSHSLESWFRQQWLLRHHYQGSLIVICSPEHNFQVIYLMPLNQKITPCWVWISERKIYDKNILFGS